MIGVLVMAYGTPRDREDVAAYYTDVRRGRPPTPELLAELVARYDAIGGTFPMRAHTEAQCRGIAEALERLAPGRYLVRLGQKHARPTVEEGVADLHAAGVRGVVGLVMAPHFSGASIGQYAARAAAAGARLEPPLPVRTVESWHTLPAYVDFLATSVAHSQRSLGDLGPAEVVFTAHALPLRAVEGGDPYPDELRQTAGAVAARTGSDCWSVAWQSAGRTPEPWTGPDVLDVLRERSAAGARAVVVCPCGFTADHLEVAYDLDIEARRVAESLGLAFRRTASVNADPAVMSGLAELVASAALELGEQA